MDIQLQQDCEQFIANKQAADKVFPWCSGLVHTCCAGIYSSKGMSVDIQTLEECRKMLKARTKIFSNFRSTASVPVTAMLASASDPSATLDNALKIYKILKKDFSVTVYLPITAMMIAQTVEPGEFGRISKRTKNIYSLIKSNQPFLTSGEDISLCVLLAMSDKEDNAMPEHIEECYRLLKKNFFTSNAARSLSNILTLYDGDAQYKCNKVIGLLNEIISMGRKYGTDHELALLGVLAMSDISPSAIAKDMTEADSWLSNQKGFGIMSSVSDRQRLMYSGLLAGRRYVNVSQPYIQITSLTATVEAIRSHQAAVTTM